MKKFILKSFVFLLPVIISFCITEIFYSTNKGDLLKTGYLADISGYDIEKVFKNELERKKRFTSISEIELKKQHNFKVLIIGDSFSGQKKFNYVNYLTEYFGDSILNYQIESKRYWKPIETLIGIINGDILENIKVNYIILETVERNVVRSIINLNREAIITVDSLNSLIHNGKLKNKDRNIDKLFSGRIKNFFRNNYNYLYDDNAFYSETYKVATSEKLFSINKKELLFYKTDLDRTILNNNLKKINHLHTELNFLSMQLAKKNIKLIVMPAPDKYDIYYEYISNKSKYPKPLFFDHFEKIQNKEYLYIDAKNLLSKHIPNKKDMYYYSDTHWSPWASQIIAKEIKKVILEN